MTDLQIFKDSHFLSFNILFFNVNITDSFKQFSDDKICITAFILIASLKTYLGMLVPL